MFANEAIFVNTKAIYTSVVELLGISLRVVILNQLQNKPFIQVHLSSVGYSRRWNFISRKSWLKQISPKYLASATDRVDRSCPDVRCMLRNYNIAFLCFENLSLETSNCSKR